VPQALATVGDLQVTLSLDQRHNGHLCQSVRGAR
jgi:hypothetical protein